MIKIKVPATSANLGPGFDCLGLALSLYNEFTFEKSNQFEFENMPKAYSNVNNLVVQSSLKTYKYLNVEPICYKMSTIDNVPVARGLGSSATCIVSGIMAAAYLANVKLSKDEIINIGTEIEGHPDNVAPAVLGSLVSGVNGKEVLYNKYDISDNLIFTVVIPNFKVKTQDARGVLPKELSYADVIYSMSRAINIPKCLEDGNVEMLYNMLDDKLHQPYRFKLIKDSDKYQSYSKENKVPFCISGSGSTMLFISNKSIKSDLEKINAEFQVLELKIDKEGPTAYEK